MLIAQLSDLHVTDPGTLCLGRIETNRGAAAAVAHVMSLRPCPDLVVITGDLVNDGTPAQYRHLRTLLAPLAALPLRVIPGNHDDRAALVAAFADTDAVRADGDLLHYVEDGFPVRVLGLDTVVPGQPDGALCARRLGWLAERLAEAPGRPTVLLMHHPPVATGIGHMDAMRLNQGAQELGALVARHPNIERILCGHIHRAITSRWHGTVVTVCPSTAHAVALDLTAAAPARWTTEPAAILLHQWSAGTGLVSHFSPTGDYPARSFL
ncbi:MAG: phosphodiesterase [Azospirillum sp.]|nr:phosphodiesterase [Azospirillum sp.]